MSTEGRAAGASSGGGRSALDDLRSLQIERKPEPSERPGARRRVPWGWLIALAVLGLLAYVLREPALRWYAEQTTPPPETAVVVRVGGAQTLLSASGYVNADAIVVVGAIMSGRLRSMPVEKGDRVKRGQLLAQLEDDELRAELALQQANFGRDQKNLTRLEVLAKGGAATQEALDNAHSQVDADRANIQLIEARIRQTRILSPIDGKVLERLVEPGAIVTPAGAVGAVGIGILKLADLRKTVVEVDVNEADIGKLKVGQPADVTLDAFPQKPYQGTLQEFAQVADKAKASVQVKVRIAEPDDNVRPGMGAKVVFRPAAGEPTEPERLVMPRRALLADGSTVYVVSDGRVARREIKWAPGKDADTVTVQSGVAEGERVILSGQDRLRPGQKVPKKD